MAIRLKAYREGQSLSQKALAKRAGLARTMIAMLESGRRKGSVKTWDRLEVALGIPQQTLRQPDPD